MGLFRRDFGVSGSQLDSGARLPELSSLLPQNSEPVQEHFGCLGARKQRFEEGAAGLGHLFLHPQLPCVTDLALCFSVGCVSL